jgi:hypothetical protein
LAGIARFDKLAELCLDETRVTDRGVGELKAARGLRSLTLQGTRVTDVAVRELQAALPEVKVER